MSLHTSLSPDEERDAVDLTRELVRLRSINPPGDEAAVGQAIAQRAERRFPYVPHPLLAPPTINVGTIAGGIKTNVVPDRCVATVDLRTLPGQDHQAIVEEVRDLAAELVSTAPGLLIDVNVTNDMPPVETATDHPLILATSAAVEEALGSSAAIRGATYYTDGGVFAPSGIPMVIFGPGDDRLAHQPNERVAVHQIARAVRACMALLERLLG